jgi:hypothetical protein
MIPYSGALIPFLAGFELGRAGRTLAAALLTVGSEQISPAILGCFVLLDRGRVIPAERAWQRRRRVCYCAAELELVERGRFAASVGGGN